MVCKIAHGSAGSLLLSGLMWPIRTTWTVASAFSSRPGYARQRNKCICCRSGFQPLKLTRTRGGQHAKQPKLQPVRHALRAGHATAVIATQAELVICCLGRTGQELTIDFGL